MDEEAPAALPSAVDEDDRVAAEAVMLVALTAAVGASGEQVLIV